MRPLALLIAVVIALLGQGACSRPNIPAKDRADFRAAVDAYQVFVVPHCAPDEVESFVSSRAARDRAFVRSLSTTALESDYRHAVAERARRDSRTFYECFGEPSPSGPPELVAAEVKRKHRAAIAAFAAAGDRQFAVMAQLRDRLIGRLNPQ